MKQDEVYETSLLDLALADSWTLTSLPLHLRDSAKPKHPTTQRLSALCLFLNAYP